MRRRLSTMLCAAAMLMLVSALPAQADFVKTDQGTVYQTSNGIVTGLQKILNSYYYFDSSGYMQSGVQVINGQWYFFSRKDGKMQFGWIRDGKKTYYADTKTGALYRSRWMGTHYFNADGTEKANALTAGGSWITKNKKTYYYNASGTPVTGMQTINGSSYYFDESGVLQKKGWITWQNNKYYADKKGVIQTDSWIGKKYYVDGSGKRLTGLQEIDGKLYYFTEKTGKLKKGKIKVSSTLVYFTDSKGEVYRSTFFKNSGNRYYAKDNGALASGLTRIGNNLYYFHRKNNRMMKRYKKTVDGKTYYFQKGGKAARSKWVKISGKYYYFQDDATMAVSKTVGDYYVDEKGVRTKKIEFNKANKINGKFYLIDDKGNAYKNTWVTIGDDKYYAGADGAALTGLQTIGKYKYYFNEKGVMEKDTMVVVGKTVYTVNKKGHITKTTTAIGDAIAAYGQKFLGNPYVYGGTSLTKGADCSGFALSVFAHFGITLMRVSDDQMHGPTSQYVKLGYKKGTRVKDKDLLPGDLIFYGTSNYSSHTAIYIGKNKVVHAANHNMGIIISDIDWVHGRIHNKAMRYWA